jgi:hypothetical protein
MNDVDCVGLEDLDRQVQAVEAQFQAAKEREEALGEEAEVEAWEQEVEGLTQHLADLLVARRLQVTLCSPGHREKEEAFRRQLRQRYRWQGWREVTVRMTHGTPVRLLARYASRSGSRRRERGLYPGLLLLGIDEHCTPGRAAEVAEPRRSDGLLGGGGALFARPRLRSGAQADAAGHATDGPAGTAGTTGASSAIGGERCGTPGGGCDGRGPDADSPPQAGSAHS